MIVRFIWNKSTFKGYLKITSITALLVSLVGCGTLTGIPSHGGGKRFAIEQMLVSTTIRGAIKEIDLTPLRGKTVFLQITSINDQGAGNMVGGRASAIFALQGITESSPITSISNTFRVFDLSSSGQASNSQSSTGGSNTSTRTFDNIEINSGTSSGTFSDSSGTNTALSNGTSSSVNTDTTNGSNTSINTNNGTTISDGTNTNTATSDGSNTNTTNSNGSNTNTSTTDGSNTGTSTTGIDSTTTGSGTVGSTSTVDNTSTTDGTGSVDSTGSTNTTTTTGGTVTDQVGTSTGNTDSTNSSTTNTDGTTVVDGTNTNTSTTNGTNVTDSTGSNTSTTGTSGTNTNTSDSTGTSNNTTDSSGTNTNTTDSSGTSNGAGTNTSTTDGSSTANTTNNTDGSNTQATNSSTNSATSTSQTSAGGSDTNNSNFQNTTTSTNNENTQQVLASSPETTTSQTRGTGYSGSAGVQYQGQGQYSNFNVPVSDVGILQSIIRTYFYLNDVKVTTDPNNPAIEAIVNINVDVFGSIRSRLDTVVYNKESVKVQTVLELMAIDYRDQTLMMAPQTGSYEANYDEKYAFWIGPLNKKTKRITHGSMAEPMLVSFDDIAQEKLERDRQNALEQQEAQPTINQPAVNSSAEASVEVTNMLTGWIKAWETSNVAGYLSFYSPSFVPKEGMNREQWNRDRTHKLTANQNIKVLLSGVRVSISPDNVSAKVAFLQKYQSIGYQDESIKTLSLEKVAGLWKILREE